MKDITVSEQKSSAMISRLLREIWLLPDICTTSTAHSHGLLLQNVGRRPLLTSNRSPRLLRKTNSKYLIKYISKAPVERLVFCFWYKNKSPKREGDL